MADGPQPQQQPCVDVDAGVVFGAVGGSLKDPDRQLPDGRILRDVAPDHAALETFDDQVDILSGGWIALNEQIGGFTVLLLLAVLGAAWCRRWWLGLDWPYLVAEFSARVNDPARWEDPVMAAHVRNLDWPQQCADADVLHQMLLRGPDRLDTGTARYCLRAGLGFLLPQHYGRPPTRPLHPAAWLPRPCGAALRPLSSLKWGLAKWSQAVAGWMAWMRSGGCIAAVADVATITG